MAKSGVAADKIQWYLIADRGDRVECVYPGMPLGETSTGELSFSPYCAQLELHVDADGGLVLKPVGDYELTAQSGNERLARSESCHGRIEISLSRNVVQIDTDMVYPAPALQSLRVHSASQDTQSASDSTTLKAGRDAESPVPARPQRNTQRDNDDPFAALLSGKRPKPPAKAPEVTAPAQSPDSPHAQVPATQSDQPDSYRSSDGPEAGASDNPKPVRGDVLEPFPEELAKSASIAVESTQAVEDIRQVFTVLSESASSTESMSATANSAPTPSDSGPTAPTVAVQADDKGADQSAVPNPDRSEAKISSIAEEPDASASPEADVQALEAEQVGNENRAVKDANVLRRVAEPEASQREVDLVATRARSTVADDKKSPPVRTKTAAMIALTAIGATLLYVISSDAPILEQPAALTGVGTAPTIESTVAQPQTAAVTSVPSQRDDQSDQTAAASMDPGSRNENDSSSVEPANNPETGQSTLVAAQQIVETDLPQDPQQGVPGRAGIQSGNQMEEPQVAEVAVRPAGSLDTSRSESAAGDEADVATTQLIASGQVRGSTETTTPAIEDQSIAVAAEQPVAVSLPSARRPEAAAENAQLEPASAAVSVDGGSVRTTAEQPAAIETAAAVASNDSQSVQRTPARTVEPPQTAAEIEEARRRALIAADRALAQGRLVRPAEASAYGLYNRVLSLDPGSTEAQKGIQSVRQGLINRALAQLASGALADARQSLQSAEDIGANPMLVADLRNEVDGRERQLQGTSEGSRGGGQ